MDSLPHDSWPIRMPELGKVARLINATASLIAKSAEHRLLFERNISNPTNNQNRKMNKLISTQMKINDNIEILLDAFNSIDMSRLCSRDVRCVCRTIPRMSRLPTLYCKNPNCQYVAFHDDCVFGEDLPEDWYCPVCFNYQFELRCPRQNVNRLAIHSSSDPEDSTGL